MKHKLAGLVLSTAVVAALPAAAATVYSNNFDDASFTAAGVSSDLATGGGGPQATAAPYNATYGNLFTNATAPGQRTELTLANLPAHTSISLSYLLAFLDSWDGENTTWGPDNLDFYIDGIKVASYTFNTALGNNRAYGGGTLLLEGVYLDEGTDWHDALVDMSTDGSLTFAHTASSIRFGWQASGNGWQGGGDESWGLDNIVVSVAGQPGTGVPEPATAALLALAAFGAGAARRRAR